MGYTSDKSPITNSVATATLSMISRRATATWAPSKMASTTEKAPTLSQVVTSTQEISRQILLKEPAPLSKRPTEKHTLGNGRPTKRVVKDRGRTIKVRATKVISKPIKRMVLASGGTQEAMCISVSSRTICSRDKAPTTTKTGLNRRVTGARLP